MRYWLVRHLRELAHRLEDGDKKHAVKDRRKSVFSMNDNVDTERCSRMRLDIFYINGGQVVEVWSCNPSNHNKSTPSENTDLYLVHGEQDLSDTVKEIVFKETIRLS